MFFAAVAVLIDHRQAIRDSGLDFSTVCERWMAFSKLAEQLVMDRGAVEAISIRSSTHCGTATIDTKLV